MTDARHVVACNGRRVPLHPTGDRRRVRRRRALSRLAAAVLPASDDPPSTRRWCSTSSTPGTSARSAAARITSRIPAGAATRRSRSTPTKPRAGALARFFAHRPHAGRDRRAAGRAQPRVSADARSAPPAESARAPTSRDGRARPTRESQSSDSRHVAGQSSTTRSCRGDLLDDYRPLAGCVRRDASTDRATAAAALASRSSRSLEGARAPTSWHRAGRTPSALIRENGVTYNVYGDPQGIDRPWQLDLIPLLISAGRVEPHRSRRWCSGRGC